MAYQQRYQAWLDDPRVDPDTKAEIIALAKDEKEIEDRFYRELEFGTAGLRGVIGAGENRMNAYVVRRAAQGLGKYLNGIPGGAERGVAIAYDSRRFSEEFALETALTLASRGIRAYLFESLRAVPQLSFAVQHLGCIAGVVITASHNPPEYNGFKVYWEHGGQIGPEQADAVMAAIMSTPWFEPSSLTKAEAMEAGLLTMIGRDVDEVYYEKTASLLLEPSLLKEKGPGLKLVYTPLFGAGSVPVQELLKRVGVSNVQVVTAQEQPNPDFPGLKAPNPEDPAAFILGEKLADEAKADVILATDPDADRLGVAVRSGDGGFTVLTGNQIGSLLLYRILSTRAARGDLPKDALVVKSIVSTHLADAICARFGVQLDDVLTGFRFVSEKIDESVKTGKHTFLFAFEESYGFLAGGFSRDKDAICAAILVAEACVAYRERGMTLYDGLQEIYKLFGYYGERVQSYTLGGKEGMEQIAGAMAALRSAPPQAVGGAAVLAFEDYGAGTRTLADGSLEPLSLPNSNMLRFLLTGGAWVCVRPSGTEPKLKLYVGANAATKEELNELLSLLYKDIDAHVRGLLE